MKRNIIILFFIPIIMVRYVSAQRVDHSRLEGTYGIKYLQGQPYTGIAFIMWNAKQIKAEYAYKDGRMHGPWRYFLENGNLWAEGNNKDGKQEGPEKKYYESGELQ